MALTNGTSEVEGVILGNRSWDTYEPSDSAFIEQTLSTMRSMAEQVISTAIQLIQQDRIHHITYKEAVYLYHYLKQDGEIRNVPNRFK